MSKKKTTVFERYFTKEIGIEFKACLYFFCILFFYSVYQVAGGCMEASIVHMAEMIGLTYAMGYVQVYLMANFDEAERLGVKEWGSIILCTLIYTGASYAGGWFDRSIVVTCGFLAYIAFAYVCVFLVYKYKRHIDEKLLNEDLKAFQERQVKDEQSN